MSAWTKRVRRALGPAAAALVWSLATSTHAQAPVPAPTAPAATAPATSPAAVAELVRRGRLDEARRALEALPDAARAEPGARYLAGRLAERSGDLEAALEALSALDAHPARASVPEGVLRDAALRRARVLLRLGRADEAEGPLRALADTGRLARALLAEAALARGALADAETRLRAAIAEEAADTDGVALRLELAEVLARTGRATEATEALRALLVARPEHPDDASVRAACASLEGGPCALATDAALDRIARLSERHQHTRALAELEGLARPAEGALEGRYLHVAGMAHYRARRDVRAAALLDESAARGGATALDDAYTAARARSRGGPSEAGVRALRAFARAHPRDARATEASYLAAVAEVELEPRRGARALDRFLASPSGRGAGDFAREARFRRALLHLDAGDGAAAERLLAPLEARAEDTLERLRVRYWRARAAALDGRRADAARAYRALVADAPLHWYALLARDRLVALGEPAPAPFATSSPTPEPAVTLVIPAEARFYAALGLDADAVRVLAASEAALRREGASTRALAEAFVAVGARGRASRLVSSSPLVSAPLTDATRWAWEAAYPRAFAPDVEAAAASRGLAPALLWALMRQESGYDPSVTSPADAIGLLQLLPSTAAHVAGELGAPFSRELLFDPAWNTRLGAAYLDGLVRELGVPLAFAAYNAGEHRVRAWLGGPRCHARWPLDRFVDWIPYQQTRNYVRRVTGHLARYLYVADPARGWPALTLPDTAGDPDTCEGLGGAPGLLLEDDGARADDEPRGAPASE